MSASKIVENPVKGKATLVKEQPQKKQGGFSLSSFSSSTKTKEEPAPAAKPKGTILERACWMDKNVYYNTIIQEESRKELQPHIHLIVGDSIVQKLMAWQHQLRRESQTLPLSQRVQFLEHELAG